MITYSEFQPTGFDPKGAFLDDDRQDWLVAPCSRTRDSEALAESNFHSCLESLGGESETVEVHSFNHWGPGWFEIILVHPSRRAEVEEIEDALENYPVLDDSDYSEREWNEFIESWENFGTRDFADMLAKEFELAEVTRGWLQYDVPIDEFREFFLRFSNETPRENYWHYPLTSALKKIQRTDLAKFLKTNRHN